MVSNQLLYLAVYKISTLMRKAKIFALLFEYVAVFGQQPPAT